jgi:hypothetical protein
VFGPLITPEQGHLHGGNLPGFSRVESTQAIANLSPVPATPQHSANPCVTVTVPVSVRASDIRVVEDAAPATPAAAATIDNVRSPPGSIRKRQNSIIFSV